VAVLTGTIAERFLAPDVERLEKDEAGAAQERREIADRLDRLEAALRGREG
jgi:hypothetical protein